MYTFSGVGLPPWGTITVVYGNVVVPIRKTFDAPNYHVAPESQVREETRSWEKCGKFHVGNMECLRDDGT